MAVLVRWWRSRPSYIQSFLIKDVAPDTVLLHQFGQGLTVPSISAFVMKLETYLRAAQIPYQNQFSRKPGPRDKLPWIQYNNQVVSDSQICMQFLNRERKIDLNRKLNKKQIDLGHLMRITAEDSLYWCSLTWRLVYEDTGTLYKQLGLSDLAIWYMRRTAHPQLWSHGIGRYTQEEVTRIMNDDLRAISEFLGDNKYLFGDKQEDVTEFDCALFGQLSQLVWQMPGTGLEDDLKARYPRILYYCQSMKDTYWPDWDERVMIPPGVSAESSSVSPRRK